MGVFQPLVQRAADLLADRPSLELIVWPDEVIDSLGHDPHDEYCEQFWLPIVGPSVYLLGRRFVILVRDNPEGLTVPLVSLAGAIGLGQGTGRNSPLIRSLSRMVAFGLGRVDPGDRLAVRRRWPPLTAARARRLPGCLAPNHDAAIQAATDAARAAHLQAIG
jgi:hypothetical protein